MWNIKRLSRVQGFALPIVLIVIALLSVLSMGLSQMARNRIQDLQLRNDLWADEKNAYDITHQAVFAMLVGDYSEQEVRYKNQTLRLDGRGANYSGVGLSVQDSSGLLGLAFFDNADFKILLESITDNETASKISAELGDWIDADNTSRFQGMEGANYVSKSLLQSPRNGPLRSLEELLYLPSMTPEILNGKDGEAGLVDLVVVGGATTFNIATAPPEVLGAVLGLPNEALLEILAARESNNWAQMLSLISAGRPIYNDEYPFLHSSRYIFKINGLNDNTVRAQIMLSPYRDDRLFSLIDWRAPFYKSE